MASRLLSTVSEVTRLFWQRITLSRLTIIYFAFSITHCAIQVGFQARAFYINQHAGSFLNSILKEAGKDSTGFAVVGNGLRFCDVLPANLKDDTCQLIWSKPGSPVAAASATVPVTATPAAYDEASSSASAAATVAAPTASPSVIISSVISTVTATQAVSTTTVFVQPSPAAQIEAPDHHDDDDKKDEELHEEDAKNDSKQFSRQSTPLSVISKRTNPPPVGHIAATTNSSGDLVVYLGDTQLSEKCVLSLIWPTQKLLNTKREDVTFISFQIWVLGMSTVALLNESMPHILASLLTHLLATAWGAFQLVHTADFKSQFNEWVTNGACQGTNLLSSYWKDRANAEIPSEVLNAVSLLVSLFLSMKLMKAFGWQTFKRVGASRTINHVYKTILCLSIAIQLALFFILASMALWIDQLYNGAIGKLASRGTLYKTLYIIVFVIMIPWLALGWFASRKEWRRRMLLFLALSVGYVVGFGVMFISRTFRLTWLTWTFFGIITTSGAVLALLTFMLGVLVRLNFGKGLPHYLNDEQPLEDDDEKFVESPVKDAETFVFPSSKSSVPAYHASFGSSQPLPPRFRSENSSRYSQGSSGASTVTTTTDPFTDNRSFVTDEMSMTPAQRYQQQVGLRVDDGRSTVSGGTDDGTISTFLAGAPPTQSSSRTRQLTPNTSPVQTVPLRALPVPSAPHVRKGSETSMRSNSTGSSAAKSKKWMIE